MDHQQPPAEQKGEPSTRDAETDRAVSRGPDLADAATPTSHPEQFAEFSGDVTDESQGQPPLEPRR